MVVRLSEAGLEFGGGHGLSDCKRKLAGMERGWFNIGNPDYWSWIARMGEREKAPTRGSYI